MTIDQLKNTLQARPFGPFNIHMGDGRIFHVPHREFLVHSPGGRTVIVFDSGDGFSILDLLLVTELEILPTPMPDQNAA
jgi:hypothetical protein